MNWHDLPDDLRLPVLRFVEAASPARFELTYSDLNMAFPRRNISAQEVEAVLACLAEHGVKLFEDPEDI